ncbi:MAG: cell division protein ZapA [Bacillota bacterium]
MDEKGKNRVAVYIMGEEYILRSSSSTEEMENVGRYVDRLMKTLSENNQQMSRQRIAVLAALNLADELLRLKQEKSQIAGETNDME